MTPMHPCALTHVVEIRKPCGWEFRLMNHLTEQMVLCGRGRTWREAKKDLAAKRKELKKTK